ncbi:anthranilate synthase component I family protein [Cryobacterium sp. CG_9.6]|uniref:anthranilate synthase component I family protein n=1 Tax=Cryobacterium sp. CG_9.6 TaxID=2760710 RepID=UPI0024748A47|nr:anthranilate synthase component I family protein [Cryobacterium sp. CG_9.6]MDH6237191.1 anthranilate/para-aminobenzoate synthase component I [Cryobacterium sp. CG_9.6]
MSGHVQHIPLKEWWDPSCVFQALYAQDSHSFWLDAGAGAQTGRSYLGSAGPRSRFVTACVADTSISVVRPATMDAPAVVSRRTIFDFLRDELPATVSPAAEPTADAGFDTQFELGWVGFLGYELGAQTVGVPVHPSRYPDAAFLEVDRAIMFDHAARTVTLIAQSHPDDPARTIDDWVLHVETQLQASTDVEQMSPSEASPTVASPTVASPTVVSPTAQWRHTPTRYAALIDECLASIRAGDAYQVCLTNEIEVAGHVDPVEAYLRLRAGSPSHHGGLLRFGETALLSASPEQFLNVTASGRVRTKPIKGTRARSTDPLRDQELARELRASEKECAENLMIVDLMRNDLGRVAELGSVAVTSLLAVESYPHVHQLVSTIEATLAPGVTGIDAVVACFPAGSMTGAPKQSAMGIINRIEDGPRGVYAGAFGYFGRDGSIDLAIVIRSIVLGKTTAIIGTGGGITALSAATEEIEETRIKAAALLAVLGIPDESCRAALSGSESAASTSGG